MKSDCYFEECKYCINKQFNDRFMECLTNRLSLAWHNCLLEIPIINKLIKKEKYCHWYKHENVFEVYHSDDSYKNIGDIIKE